MSERLGGNKVGNTTIGGLDKTVSMSQATVSANSNSISTVFDDIAGIPQADLLASSDSVDVAFDETADITEAVSSVSSDSIDVAFDKTADITGATLSVNSPNLTSVIITETGTNIGDGLTLGSNWRLGLFDAVQFSPVDYAGFPVEYVEESSFTEEVDSPSMNWIGYVTSYTSEISTNSNRFPLDNPSDNTASWKKNVNENKNIAISLNYIPQDFTFFKYFTGASDSLSDTITPIQFGESANGNFLRLLGCFGTDITMTISEDSLINVDCSFNSAHTNGWDDEDYTNSHAVESSDPPLSYDDLSNIKYKGEPIGHNVSSLELSISNKYREIRDPTSRLLTEIDTVRLMNRGIEISLTLNYEDMSLLNDVISYFPGEFTFDIGSTTFTLERVQFPEFQNVNNPAELKGATITSDPVANLTYK